MTLTVAEFRAAQPAFIDPIKYLDSTIQFYLNLAYSNLNACRWGDTVDYGATLFAAHFLALSLLAASGGQNGVPGTVVGVLSGGGVDKVNYTRDVASIMEENAGHWGMTSFGLIFLRFLRMMGAGAVQIGTGDYGPQSGAWPGPIPGYF